VEDHVIDPRRLGTQAVIEGLVESFESRDHTRQILSTSIDSVKARARAQFARITEMLEAHG
jgi:hypothetical protein